MKRGHLYILSAPSGAGKSSLIQAILQRQTFTQLGVSVSHTTRMARPNEVEGENYYFVDLEHFNFLIRQQAFVEYAEVFGHYYGTSQQEIEQRLQQGWDIFLDIDWQGARQVKARIPEARKIFILPPSQAILRQRLIERQQDSENVINARMQQAVAEMSHYHEYDYLIINDDFEQAVGEIESIICSDRLRKNYQMVEQQQLIAELLV